MVNDSVSCASVYYYIKRFLEILVQKGSGRNVVIPRNSAPGQQCLRILTKRHNPVSPRVQHWLSYTCRWNCTFTPVSPASVRNTFADTSCDDCFHHELSLFSFQMMF